MNGQQQTKKMLYNNPNLIQANHLFHIRELMEASYYKSLTGANTLFACKVAGNFAPFKIL